MRWYTFCPRLPEALGPAQWESGAARASQNSGASAIRAFFPPESCHRIHDIDSCLGLPFCSSFSLSSTLFHSSAQGHSEMVVRAALPRPPLASAKAPVYTRTPSPSAVPLAGHQSHAPILCAAVAVWLAFAQPSLADPRTEGTLLDPARCTVASLDKFASTRAQYSLEASGGGMTEALVDVSGCQEGFQNRDLTGKVLSGVLLRGADFSGSKLVRVEMSRADATGANLSGVDFTDANCYGTSFDGADLRDANFENAILSSASFGRDRSGTWANLRGTTFVGALVSSSDVQRICENPTLLPETRKSELGCRGGR